jgi:hypothetical protein
VGYICEFHKRVAGVEAKPHTRQFIEDEFQNAYKSFAQSGASASGPVMLLDLNIYEVTDTYYVFIYFSLYFIEYFGKVVHPDQIFR